MVFSPPAFAVSQQSRGYRQQRADDFCRRFPLHASGSALHHHHHDHHHLLLLLPNELISSSTVLSATSSSIGSSSTPSDGVVAAAVVYDPIMPSTETLVGMGLIVVLCAMVAYVWQTQVVPTSRTNLALSKRQGPVKEYLDELRKSSDPTTTTGGGGGAAAAAAAATSTQSNGMSSSTITSVDGDGDGDTLELSATRTAKTAKRDRALERWLFTDWLQDNKSAKNRKPGRQKEPALPILKDAKWNSGDNPVLAATLLISMGVLFTAVTERIASAVS